MKKFHLVSCVALMFVSTNCALLKPAPQQVEACAEAAIQAQLNAPGGLITQVTSILTGQQLNWQAALDALLVAAGPAAVCAVQAVVADLEKGAVPAVAGAAMAALPKESLTVGAMRGNAWLASGQHYTLIK
jgi:hypothetical protein